MFAFIIYILMCVIFASFQECVVANCYYIQFSRFNVPPIGINANYDPFRNKMSKFLPSFLPSLIYHHLYIIVNQQSIKQNSVPKILHLIRRVSNTKSLGLHIHEKLSWTKQIDALSRKISSTIGGLKRIRQYVPFKTLIIFHL